MGITIRKRLLQNKETSLFLDICHNGKRWSEFTKIRLQAGSSLKVREHNKQMMEYAEQLKTKIWGDILNSMHGIGIKKGKVNFFDFISDYIEAQKGSKSIYDAAYKKLKKFHGRSVLYTTEVDERFLERFYDFLEASCTGETPITYFKKIQRILKFATKKGFFQTNPGADIKNRKFRNKEREIFLIHDLKMLKNTPCNNTEVKDAFIFSCLTGLRFSDIKQLSWSNISGNKLVIDQQKTKQRVSIVLNNDAQYILSRRTHKTGLVFTLPCHTGCLKHLHNWVFRSGIDKWVGWHSSRHTFGSNLIFHGTDIYTASKLMGHKSLVHTQRYLRESDDLKDTAVNKLPKIF